MFANAACGAIYVLFFSLLLSRLSLSFEPYQTCQLVGSGNHRNAQESSMAGSKLGSLEANTGIQQYRKKMINLNRIARIFHEIGFQYCH
jgi:hypothetical protein